MVCHVFARSDEVAAELVHRTVTAADEAIAARGVFSLVLTGGSAATALYPVLAQAPLRWSHVHVFFGDERLVPPEHSDSNYRLARETLLARVPIRPAHVHRICGELAAEEAAARAEREILEVTHGVLDVVHLGMGPDGHVCSLFPSHPLLDERERLVAPILDSPKPPASRATLTLPALARARALLFLVLGASKADAVRASLLETDCALPAAMAARGSRDVTWLLDADAARFIRNG